MNIAAQTVQAAARNGAAHSSNQAANELSRAVALRKPEQVKPVNTLQITPMDLEANIPAIPAAQILDAVYKVIEHYSRVTVHEMVIGATWVASTYFADIGEQGITDGRLMFESHPRLFTIAPKGSGKTRFMKVIRAMARNSTSIGKNVTQYGLRDQLHAGRTVFLDEVHRIVGSTGRANMAIQTYISAYEADVGSWNSVNGQANDKSTFGPMMLAAQPFILNARDGFTSDLIERSFLVKPVKHNNMDDPIPDLDDEFFTMTERIRNLLSLWGAAMYSTINGAKYYRPIHSVPRVLTDRMREISGPLLAVADRAVDPDVVAKYGHDTRWAIRTRDSVKESLLGYGDNAREIMAKLREQFVNAGFTFDVDNMSGAYDKAKERG